jgi:hypothetical protein
MQRAACAFTVDVAGQDERAEGGLSDGYGNLGRDSTTLSIFEIDVSTLEIMQAPTFRVVRRQQWTGLNHLTVFGQLKALAEQWRPPAHCGGRDGGGRRPVVHARQGLSDPGRAGQVQRAEEE